MSIYKRGEDKTLDRINDLLLEFKSGNKDSSYELYRCFEGFIVKKSDFYKNLYCVSDNKTCFDDMNQDFFLWFLTYAMQYNPSQGTIFTVYITRKMESRIRYIYQQINKMYDREHEEFDFDNATVDGVECSVFEEKTSLLELLKATIKKPKRGISDELATLLGNKGYSVETLKEVLNNKEKLAKLKRTIKTL